MIRNDNKVGNYWVLVYSGRNSIASFECPTWADAELEANRIASERRARGLPTRKAEARQLLRNDGPRKIRLGPAVPIEISGREEKRDG